MVTSGQRDAEDVFPEHFVPIEVSAEDAAEAILDPENGLDFSQVVHTEVTEEQYQEYVRQMMDAELSEPEAGEPEHDGEWV
jgi:hypothetical protein